MSTPHPRHRQDDDRQHPIVDADSEPGAQRAEDLERDDNEDTQLAQELAEVAIKLQAHAAHETEAGKKQAGHDLRHEALMIARVANHLLDEVGQGDKEVERLLEGQRQDVSQALVHAPNQSLFTLRDAVDKVQTYVAHLSELEVVKLSKTTGQSEVVVEQKRSVIIAVGEHIDVTLNNIEQARKDPNALARDLMMFFSIAWDLAQHLPKLLEMMNELAEFLSHFHL
ncbi:MAG TPA: hypothetical protein VE338_14170 [Ktedonobacterales bacterium]|nr:hypothetical protein [Ktedonobacterales bacterium]